MIYKYGVDPDMAGDIPAILPFGTILLTPLFGSLYDRIGKGATLMVIGAIMLVAVHVLFALPILNEWWFALIVMVLLSRSFRRPCGPRYRRSSRRNSWERHMR